MSSSIEFYSDKYFHNPAAVVLTQLPPRHALPDRGHQRAPSSSSRKRNPSQKLPDVTNAKSPRRRRDVAASTTAERQHRPGSVRSVQRARSGRTGVVAAAADAPPRGAIANERVVGQVLQEVIASEIKYVLDLKTLVSLVIAPIYEAADSDPTALLTGAQARACFPDPSPILHVHSAMLADLAESVDSDSGDPTGAQVDALCDILLSHMESLREPYTAFIAMHSNATFLVSKLRESSAALADHLRSIHDDAALQESIGSMMIRPIQRLPRYLLFLERLDAHLDRSTAVARTIAKFGAFLRSVNAAAARVQPLEQAQWNEFGGRIQLVAAGRRLLHRGVLRRVLDANLARGGTAVAFWARHAGEQRLTCFLCDDVLVCGAKSSGGVLALKAVLSVVGMDVDDLERELPNGFEVSSGGESFAFVCDDARERDDWLDRLGDAIEAAADRAITDDQRAAIQRAIAADPTELRS